MSCSSSTNNFFDSSSTCVVSAELFVGQREPGRQLLTLGVRGIGHGVVSNAACGREERVRETSKNNAALEEPVGSLRPPEPVWKEKVRL